MTHIITLAGRQVEVTAPPLGRLKRIVPAFVRAGAAISRGRFDDAAMDDFITIVAEGTGLPVGELEALAVTLDELKSAVETIATVAGLAPQESAQGEARPAAESHSSGTNSTAG